MEGPARAKLPPGEQPGRLPSMTHLPQDPRGTDRGKCPKCAQVGPEGGLRQAPAGGRCRRGQPP
eukprot:9744406-Alexandrium_andersonii.AAC.1